jgi:6-pyruvoyl-tetrahydropterin synthase
MGTLKFSSVKPKFEKIIAALDAGQTIDDIAFDKNILGLTSYEALLIIERLYKATTINGKTSVRNARTTVQAAKAQSRRVVRKRKA